MTLLNELSLYIKVTVTTIIKIIVTKNDIIYH